MNHSRFVHLKSQKISQNVTAEAETRQRAYLKSEFLAVTDLYPSQCQFPTTRLLVSY